MLKTQLSQGNNGLTKTKYLTFGIEADSIRQAKPRLAHVQNDLMNNFRQLGVRAQIMNGKERLKLMEYLSVRQTAEKWGISTKRIQFICKQGRIPGAYIIGNSWAIPADAEKPKDERIKSGKYIKKAGTQNEQ